MKTEKNILIAFLLNTAFSVIEFIGGAVTGSVAILSDAVHDLGDALSIGISYFLERKSRKAPDETYTFGYGRYSVIGSVVTTAVLLVGSAVVFIRSISRIVNPVPINYNGMMILGIFGVIVNLAAALVTREGDSLNQKAVNLHMLEDVMGWIVVLIGAVVMRFTDLSVIDPLMSIGVSVFIIVSALKNLRSVMNVFLERTPDGISTAEIREHISEIGGVADVHHIHLWSMDGSSNFATLHVVSDRPASEIKSLVREELSEHGISHSTIEIETTGETCRQHDCTIEPQAPAHHHHHH